MRLGFLTARADHRGVARGAAIILLASLGVLVVGAVWLLNLSQRAAEDSASTREQPSREIARGTLGDSSGPRTAQALETPTTSAGPEALAPVHPEKHADVSTDREPGIYLEIHVSTPLEANAHEGMLNCVHGPTGLSDPGRVQRLDTPITRDATTIRLPLTSEEALVTAYVSGFPPESVIVKDLRIVDGKRVPEGRSIDRDVMIRVGSGSGAAPILRGAIYVDGDRRAPKGLLVRIVPSGAMENVTRDKSYPAAVDSTAAMYSASELPPGDWLIQATSEETQSSWTQVRAFPNGEPRVIDLNLTRGAKLVLEVRDASTREIARDQELTLQCWIQTEVLRDRTFVRDIVLNASSNADGLCQFSGVPRARGLSIYLSNARPARELLTLTLPATGPDEVHDQVWINGRDPRDVEYFGDVPIALLGQGQISVRARVGDGQGVRRVGANGGQWKITCRADTGCVLWLERDFQRATETATVRAAAGSYGPVILQPIVHSRLHVEWKNAPLDRSLELAALDPNGGVPNCVKVPLTAASGAVDLDSFPTAALSVKLMLNGGSFVLWTWTASQRSDPFVIDLGGDRMRPIELYANADRPKGSSGLIVVALDSDRGADRALANLRLEDGKRTDALPMFQGASYYRLNRECSASIVCGVIDEGAEAAKTSPLTIHWTGTPCSFEQLGLSGNTGVRVVKCEGRPLDAVHELLRQFDLNELVCPDRDSSAHPTTSVTCNPVACEFRAYR
jgi:hypothetical protein